MALFCIFWWFNLFWSVFKSPRNSISDFVLYRSTDRPDSGHHGRVTWEKILMLDYVFVHWASLSALFMPYHIYYGHYYCHRVLVNPIPCNFGKIKHSKINCRLLWNLIGGNTSDCSSKCVLSNCSGTNKSAPTYKFNNMNPEQSWWSNFICSGTLLIEQWSSEDCLPLHTKNWHYLSGSVFTWQFLFLLDTRLLNWSDWSSTK